MMEPALKRSLTMPHRRAGLPLFMSSEQCHCRSRISGLCLRRLCGRRRTLQDALGHFTYDDDSPSSRRTLSTTLPASPRLSPPPLRHAALSTRSARSGHAAGRVAAGLCRGPSSGERARMSPFATCWPTIPACPDMSSSSAPASTPAALLRACLQLPLEAEPGTRAEYSDPGFILLGKALEVLTARRACHVGAAKRFRCPSNLDRQPGFAPPASCRSLHPADRRGHLVPSSPHPGRSAG